jgi:Ca-activated chloride channel family protein
VCAAVTAVTAPASFRVSGAAQQTLKVNVDLVNVFMTVQDEHGNIVTDLTREDFVVHDDRSPQQIAVFEKNEKVRSALAVLLDTSGSVVDILPYETRGLREFAKTLTPPDQYFVITFGTSIRMIHRSPDSQQHLEQVLQHLRPYGTSVLFDAMLYAMDRVNSSDNPRKALIIFTDGNDNGSTVEYRRVVEQAQVSGVLVYFVAIGSPLLVDKHTVDSLSRESGGRVLYVPKADAVLPHLEKIRRELAQQYYVGYYISRTPGYHQIRVEIPGRKNLRVLTRSGYLVR